MQCRLLAGAATRGGRRPRGTGASARVGAPTWTSSTRVGENARRAPAPLHPPPRLRPFVSDDDSSSDLLSRAQRLLDDLNMTTLGWQMPSDRIVEDFAAGEHRLVAREHAVTDVDQVGERSGTRRAFSLYAPH